MLTQKPIGFEGTVCWEDDSPDSQEYNYISFSEELFNHEGQSAEEDIYGVRDDCIFFYANDEQLVTLQKAIINHSDSVTIEPHSGWYIDLTEPYEFIYELAHQED